MARRGTAQLAYQAIRIEGGLIPADELARLTTLQTPDKTEQTDSHYGISKGLKLRDEIARFWKIALSLWVELQPLLQRQDVNAHDVTVREFLLPLLRDVLGFADIARGASVEAPGHTYNVGHAARGGQLPLILAAHNQQLDDGAERFGEQNPETGRIRRRSPFMLAQEALNASDKSLWAMVSNGLTLRILRDNPSLTRPAYVEVDLEAMFTEELYADFAAFWLLAHASRFGKSEAEPSDCPWERWRNAGQAAGVRARDRLRDGVAEALRALGTGFLSHPANSSLRDSLLGRPGALSLSKQAFFEELLRLVYRLIFLATVEDRVDASTGQPLVFAPATSREVRHRYLDGYSLTTLRARSARRSAYDRHHDCWLALSITFNGLARGEPGLGLPPLGGLFDTDQCTNLASANIENRWLLGAIFQLGYFRETTGLTRVNYRDMGPEELGSVYESLLELVPDLQGLSNPQTARLQFVGDFDEAQPSGAVPDPASSKGNTRKLTGSYYTPDSLVQELIKSALVPVITSTLKANPQRPVDALLELTICDPACGSGHFLLAGARRLAEEVATLRAAGGVPNQSDYRHALRDVVSRCIYGVDKNPMAIALAKTALWLEAYTPDLPLSFLDHHLRCGDALLGLLDPSILNDGVPDRAFDALSSDDRDVSKRLKRANREARSGIQRLQERERYVARLNFAQESSGVQLESMSDDSIAALNAKRQAFLASEEAVSESPVRLAADLFVAAFALPKSKSCEKVVPTTQDIWLAMNGDAPRSGVAAAATEAALGVQTFHWWQAFPSVHASGGFDVLLGNPPWERIKMQEEEFFASRSPLISEAPHKAERVRRIELLASGMLLHTLYPDVEAAQGLRPPNLAEQMLHAEFLVAHRSADTSKAFARESGRFPLSGQGDVNTYALFAETCLQLMAEDGRCGIIVPTGIATDDSTKDFFETVSQSGRLVSLFDIENREGVFPAVHRSYKFCLLTLGMADVAEFACFASQSSQLADERRRFSLTPSEFRLLSPNSRTCPLFRSKMDAEITKRLYRAAPILFKEATSDQAEQNPWRMQLSRMFHMADDSSLFQAEASAGSAPLYEAKMIHLFDHRWSMYANRGEGARDCSVEEKSDPEFRIRPRYWMPITEVQRWVTVKDWKHEWLLGWRDICRSTDERTVIATVLPKVAAGNTIAFLLPDVSAPEQAALLGNLSSLVLDYVARQKVGGTHLTYGYLNQFPVLPPERYEASDFAFIVPRVLELTYTSVDLGEWARELGFIGKPFAWNADRRAVLRAELDAYYANMYGLGRNDLRYILDPADVMGEDYPSETFRVLKNNDRRKFGEYRTQRLTLDAWDRLSAENFAVPPCDIPAVLDRKESPISAYYEQSLIRNESEARLAGLVAGMLQHDGALTRDTLQSALSAACMDEYVATLLPDQELAAFRGLVNEMPSLLSSETLARLPQILARLEKYGSIAGSRAGLTVKYQIVKRELPSDVIQSPELARLGRLVLKVEAQRLLRHAESSDVPHDDQGGTQKSA